MQDNCPKCGGNLEHITRINNAQKNFPSEKNIIELSDFYKVMGDQTRLKLLMTLEAGRLCVSDLSCILNMSLSAISHQLKVLRTAKLVKTTKIGKEVYYELDDDHIKDILEKGLEHIREEH